MLDTHIWLWLVNGDDEVRKAGFIPIINRAAHTHGIAIPAIACWEVAMLAIRGRITLNENTLDWLRRASAAPGISVYPLTPEVAHESTVLPGTFHGDPADQMIVATARILDHQLLTLDRRILEYAAEGHVKVVPPRHH
ncbi:MAG: type II toxin-antitoxin system VapC family toxin [Planctomycetota bacterium]